MKPRLLDLFCGAGGAAKGYQRAGFYVVGVDNRPQPRYCGDEFVQADALNWLTNELTLWADPLRDFDAIHASPPCQAFSAYQRSNKNRKEHANLIPATRELLNATELPWVIENVYGAPLVDPLMLCGSMFDLDVQRHRYFESNISLEPPAWPCRHGIWGPDRFPGGRSLERTGTTRGLVRACVEVGSWDTPLKVQKAAMGIDWMTREELSQAIPPAFAELVGHQLMQHVRQAVA